MNSSLGHLFGSVIRNGTAWNWATWTGSVTQRMYLGIALAMAWTVGWLLLAPPLRAQSAATSTWRDGCRLIDSASPADIVAAESILRQSIAGGAAPPEAVCGLALARLRQEDPSDALAVIASLPNQYAAAELESTRALALRVRLCAALMIGDAVQAQQAYRDLVRLIAAATSDPVDLRYGAITIGVVIAMLDNDLAASPIPKKDLAIGRDCMFNSKVHGVAGAYTAAYAQASERAGELIRQFALIAEKGLDAVADENLARMQALDKTLNDLAEQKELTDEVFRNAREQTQQNTRDRRKLDNLLASIQAKLRQPTPGHPGRPRPAPGPPPNRGAILVDEYETRTEWETVLRNGELIRIPVIRQVRRPQYEIDSERDFKFQQVLNDYQRLIREHDRYAENYQKALKSWTEADRSRRQELDNERAEAEAKRSELITASEHIKEQQRDTAKHFSAQRSAKDQEEFEIELQHIAVTAAQSQDIPSAFRPRYFPVISYLQEKVLLLRQTVSSAQ